MKIKRERLAYLKKNARLLFLHAKSKKKSKIHSMDVLKGYSLKCGAGVQYYHRYRSNIDSDYV